MQEEHSGALISGCMESVCADVQHYLAVDEGMAEVVVLETDVEERAVGGKGKHRIVIRVQREISIHMHILCLCRGRCIAWLIV